jgi:hypothetical protein
LAIELSASSFCAREMRGTQSIASTVAPRCVSRSSIAICCAGQTKPISVACFFSSAASSTPRLGWTCGGRTLITTSTEAHRLAASTMAAPAAL